MDKSEFTNLLLNVPKAELHIHLEAVITLSSVKKLYKNFYGKDMTKDDQKSIFSYDNLNGFIKSFLKVQDMFKSEDDFILVFDDLKKYLVANKINYCEVFFAPTAFLKKGFSYEKMVEIFHKKITEIKEKENIGIKLLMDVSRTFGCENAMENYKLLKQYPCEDIIGIGLGGAEQKGPAKDFAPVFELALKEGYKAVAHAGEDVGPEQRIGHGITAIQDDKLMQTLADTQLPLEICITSNTFTKAVIKEAKDHPIRTFYDKGMLVTVNTDDPVFFKTTLIDEFWICYKELNFTLDEIKQLVKNSFNASFLPDSEKEEWCKKVEKAFN